MVTGISENHFCKDMVAHRKGGAIYNIIFTAAISVWEVSLTLVSYTHLLLV